MRDNECIVYISPDILRYYDMFILNFLRFELEAKKSFGYTYEEITSRLIYKNDLEYFDRAVCIELIKCVDMKKQLYNTNDDFTATQRFTSISRQNAVVLYDLFNQVDDLDLEKADIIIGVYVYLVGKLKGRAYNNLIGDFYFSYKSLCKNLECEYDDISVRNMELALKILSNLGLIKYAEKALNPYKMPFLLEGVSLFEPNDFYNGERIAKEIFKKGE